MLAAERGPSSITIPPPLTRAERVERLARVMKPCGPDEVRSAWRKAFRPTHGEIRPESAPRGDALEDLSAEDKRLVDRVHTLRDVYHLVPELKQPGVVTGFPSHGDLLEKVEFCKQLAAKALLAKRRKESAARIEAQPEPKSETPAGNPA
jgi:hypothetical protein